MKATGGGSHQELILSVTLWAGTCLHEGLVSVQGPSKPLGHTPRMPRPRCRGVASLTSQDLFKSKC